MYIPLVGLLGFINSREEERERERERKCGIYLGVEVVLHTGVYIRFQEARVLQPTQSQHAYTGHHQGYHHQGYQGYQYRVIICIMEYI